MIDQEHINALNSKFEKEGRIRFADDGTDPLSAIKITLEDRGLNQQEIDALAKGVVLLLEEGWIMAHAKHATKPEGKAKERIEREYKRAEKALKLLYEIRFGRSDARHGYLSKNCTTVEDHDQFYEESDKALDLVMKIVQEHGPSYEKWRKPMEDYTANNNHAYQYAEAAAGFVAVLKWLGPKRKGPDMNEGPEEQAIKCWLRIFGKDPIDQPTAKRRGRLPFPQENLKKTKPFPLAGFCSLPTVQTILKKIVSAPRA